MAHARPWFVANRRDIIRGLAPVLGLAIAWSVATVTPPNSILLGLVAFALVHLGLIALRRSAARVAFPAARKTIDWLATICDALLCALLIGQADTLGDAIYPLYVVLALRALSAYRRLPVAVMLPFVFGPTYLYAAQMSQPNTPISAFDRFGQWGLLFGSLSFGVIAILISSVQQRVNSALRKELRAEQQEREARVSDLERSANDLRARMRQLHALEEGLRVITSTLSLDEVLNQIVDSTLQMLGAARVQGMVLSLETDAGFDHRLFLLQSDGAIAWANSLAGRAMQQQVPLIIGDTTQDATLATTMPEGLRAALCVPLFVGDGPPQGALTVVTSEPSAFSSSDARHLTALAMQAGIAIHNAELHSQIGQQRRLLEAVIRDINDGLVVVDARSQIVLSNPLGQALLEDEQDAQQIQSQLLALAASLRVEGKPTLTCELRLKREEDEPEQIYQAFGSQVRQDDDEEPLVAIVLHDITAQKAEEQSRTEFISMVAHELRNPLNSLNGFIKVVLRGQAGALTALQHEFLEIADGQVEQLKGRISELLEYNRVEAGRLVLDPQWNDMSLLVAGAATRLSLQAEQNGLTLVNEVDRSLPDCLFDGERIGQVLNNLIENAIKATPPGGSITLRSEQYEDEIWIRVCDTGVGIPADEQTKIFQRFYRAHNRKSSKGNHLGLGLAICQQIIASHNGRLWVESEEGRGSCFTFALPLTAREVVVNEQVEA
ncbi:MAG TPA: ATP-binding protein [Roseiflexaceae bacterium]|nr:ATP-binding protein [Roseiflexaceae bacterium]